MSPTSHPASPRRAAPAARDPDGHAPCAICAGPRLPLYRWAGMDCLSCARCGCESVEPLPSAQDLLEFYQSRSSKKLARAEIRRRLAARAVDHYLKDYARHCGGRMPEAFADLGGGEGLWTRAAQDRGVHACLIDYAGDVLGFARDSLGVEWIVEGDIQRCAEFLPPARFDFALARHVIEHMREPDLFLRQAARILRPGGLLEVETPNIQTREQFAHPAQIRAHQRLLRLHNPSMTFGESIRLALGKSFSGVNPPKHLWGFTQRALEILLGREGFEVLQVRRALAGDPIYDPLFHDYHRLATRRGLGIPYFFFERAASQLCRRNGMNLAILARKKG